MPPWFTGMPNATETDALRGDAVPMIGAVGRVAAITGLVAADAPPWPTAFVAETEHVYVTPGVTTTWKNVAAGLKLVSDFTAPPPTGTQRAVWERIGLPPSNAGGVECTCTALTARVGGLPSTGASGTVAGTAGSDGPPGCEAPTALIADTVHV
jgi:hypothetical protein